MKPRFNIISLTSCTGCISTLISLDIFPQFLERTTINYFPFVLDADDIDECEVALVEGCISEEAQINLVRKIRKSAKKVFALGTCACFGGILSLSNSKKAEPLSNHIELDGIIPGCPPPSKFFGNCLIKIVSNQDIVLSEKNMCANCPVREKIVINSHINITKINPNPEEIRVGEENSECFLKNSILCLGPITRDGCEHQCIKMGLPCEGCMGPVSKDFTSNAVNYLSLIDLSQELKNYTGIYYRFSKPNINR